MSRESCHAIEELFKPTIPDSRKVRYPAINKVSEFSFYWRVVMVVNSNETLRCATTRCMIVHCVYEIIIAYTLVKFALRLKRQKK